MKLATTTGDFSLYTNDQLKIMEYIKQSGFDYVDYSFGIDYNSRSGVYSDDWKDYAKRVKEHCEKIGVKLIQSHAPMGRPLADGNEDFLNDTKRCIEACAEMGIPNVVIHSGYLPGISKQECLERNKAFYEKLLPLAEKHDVTILTENFDIMCIEGMYWIDNAPDLLELLELVNHPLFHTVWDCGHANMQPLTQEQGITLLSDHIKGLHIHDNNGEKDFHMFPYLGTLDMDSFVAGLKKIGYDGYFTFEAARFLKPSATEGEYFKVDLQLKLAAEKMLYELGRSIVQYYSL